MYRISIPAKSNRASWVFTGLVTDLEDNPIDLTNCALVFQIRSPREGAQGYGHFGGFSDNYPGASLMASTANGKITIVALGTFRCFFSLQDMRGLCPGTYDTGLTVTSVDGTQTVQLAIGPLAIVDGVVP